MVGDPVNKNEGYMWLRFREILCFLSAERSAQLSNSIGGARKVELLLFSTLKVMFALFGYKAGFSEIMFEGRLQAARKRSY